MADSITFYWRHNATLVSGNLKKKPTGIYILSSKLPEIWFKEGWICKLICWNKISEIYFLSIFTLM